MFRFTITVTRRAKAGFSDEAAKKAAAAALKAAGYRGRATLDLFFVGNAEIKRLNRRWRGKNRPTDVLSFPLRGAKAWPGAGEELGDIVISIPTARADAAKYGRKYRDELTLLLVHGILHLLGFDHLEEKDRKRMFGVQNAALAKLGTGREVWM